ncbi:MAG TPA: TonB-dependent receptor [Candidatus Baltobacteraceae bacterium]|nr:TonB-dependent receptor [Verrucomicrobiae bacterium]HTX14091.1 TonB-dependent receptor [Candidatus Baltobacteraceae bacterium]
MRLRNSVCFLVLTVLAGLAGSTRVLAQINTVNLSGVISDPQGLAVKGAQLTLKNLATGAERATTSDSSGRYEIFGLPPGGYSLRVEAAGFAVLTNASLTLVLGTNAEYNAQLELKSTATSISVSAAPELVDTAKTEISTTITQRQIDDLPINGRNYINFTLLDSQSARDDTPSIGAAPTSGLNFGGQRARSNEVSIDGADAVDKSVGGVRATVSQEAVQEFQVITSDYMPEYGRAMGGVVNIVTKSGSNEVHGDVFGYLRNGAIQAQNPFSVRGSFDPTTDSVNLTPVKQSFTRVQAGATIGGPIQKDKTFYFFSYETTRSQATGFTNIGENNFGLVAVPGASVCSATPLLLTGPATDPTSQAGFYPAAISAAGGCTNANAIPFIEGAALSGGASAVALLGNTGALPPPYNSFPEDGTACGGAPCALPASFQGLASLVGNFPTHEGTSLWSARLDHIWNNRNSSFLRVGVSPSTVTGIEVNAQNQTFGQNAGNRTSYQQTRDLDVTAQHTTSISNDLFNELRFQYARRGLHYGYSDLPGGSDPAVNITGFAFFGREPFSTEDRVERRFQLADNISWTKGRHSFKFGVDSNFIHIGTNASQIFTLNYGGVYDFGSLGASTFGFPSAFPGFNAVQSYGLGIPTSFYQGIGNTDRPSSDNSLGVFVQDSWKISRKLTLNYGVRYDIEWAPIFPAATSINATAEQALGVIQGIPLNTKNVAPRIGIAWDPWGDGKTVIRASYGIFYDNPSLALAFLANAFDGADSSLLETAGGTPCVLTAAGCDIDNPANFSTLNATNIFQGLLTGNITGCSTSVPSMCYQANQQRFNSFQPNSLFTQQNFLTYPPAGGPFNAGYPLTVLPYTVPVTRNFKFAYAQQANLTVEREVTKDLKISFAYNYTHGVHLDRTLNLNVTNPGTLIVNDNNAVAAGLVTPGTNPLTISNIPTAAGCQPTPLGGSIDVIAPGILGVGFPVGNTTCSTAPVSGNSGFIGTPAVFNYFRPSGPNPSFAALVPGGYATLVGLAQTANFPVGVISGGAPVPVPWSDVNPQTSTGNSLYNAFTVTVTKRFSDNFQLLSGWTWSHTIDDSTDLSTLLNPQDNSNPNGDRGNSDFDQRHRWITSAIFQSPYHSSDSGAWKKFLANFMVAPIIEVSSGRPYNILIGYDTNLDFGTATNRPSFLPAGAAVPPGFPAATVSPYIKSAEFILPTECVDSSLQPFGPYPDVPAPPYGCVGNLGRNAFTKPGYFDIDLRIQRTIPINERWNLQIIADGFNLLNRFNVSDVNPVCDPTAGLTTCAAGQPTAAFDPRTFQFALKVNW